MVSKGIWGKAAAAEEPLKGEAAPFPVTMQATDDKAKMASADRGCSSAPLFHGPQIEGGGGIGCWECVGVCVLLVIKESRDKSYFITTISISFTARFVTCAGRLGNIMRNQNSQHMMKSKFKLPREHYDF